MKQVYAIYFSPTYTSKKSATTIAEVVQKEYQEIDLITTESIHEFKKEDFVVFGFPVYGGRMYHGAIEKLKLCKGHNTPCVLSVTYGNRHYDDALLELYNITKELGFICIGAAALIGEHTYGSIQEGRPNALDVKEDQRFALQVVNKIKQHDFSSVALPGHYPYQEGGNGGHFIPQTNANCNQCMLCVKACPMQAIASDCKTIDPKTCISCFRCLKFCPKHAKNMDHDVAYQIFAKEFSKKLKEPRKNEYFI